MVSLRQSVSSLSQTQSAKTKVKSAMQTDRECARQNDPLGFGSIFALRPLTSEISPHGINSGGSSFFFLSLKVPYCK